MDKLKFKYRQVLIGFEKYSFSEQVIRQFEPDFELALHDYEACQDCEDALCKTSLNYKCSDWYKHLKAKTEKCNDKCYPQVFRGYYALHHKGCSMYNRPAFAVFPCPGVVERKEQIIQALVSVHVP